MAFYPFQTQLQQLAGGTVPGSLTLTGSLTAAGITDSAALSATTIAASGIISQNAGSNSSGSAPLLTTTNTNGTAAQLTDTTRDYMIYLSIGTAGTALTINIGPTVGVADLIYTASTASAGELFSFRLPAGWFWKWAATTATLAEQTAIGC